MKTLSRLTALLLCVCLLLAGVSCGQKRGIEGATLRLALDAMPVNLDPQLADSDEARLIARNCFEGLFRMEQGVCIPAACEKWETSDDGLTCTFTLRKDLFWSDGEPVTAADFRFGLLRALRPETRAPGADRLACVEGGAALSDGTGTEEALGVTARDARTLVIRLIRPDPLLTETLTYAMAMPCREDVFDAAAGRYGMSADLIVCNGPFTVDRWSENTLELMKNGHYGGPFEANPAGVTLTFGDADAERIDAINKGMTDLGLLRAQSADEAENARLKTYRHPDTTWMLWIRPDAKTVGDPAVSAAFLLALDRTEINDVLPGGFTASRRLLADDLKTAHRRVADAVSAPAAPSSDPQRAQPALVAALKPYGGALPTLTLRYADEEGLKAVAGRIAQQWQKELGAVVNIESVTTADLLAAVDSGQTDLALLPLTANDGRAVTALKRLSGWLGAAPAQGDSPEVAAAWEQALLADSHIFPIAQSGRCLAASADVTGVEFDLQQGLLPLYKLGK